MLDRVLKTISRYNMLPPGVRVMVAVSGGADSVCLLHVLKELAPACLVGVIHFNHKLRGEASDQDQRFVAELAQRFELNLKSVSENIAERGGNLEQEGHLARKRLFTALKKAKACDAIALGHTRDDQAETVLFRLLRGSGLAGLAAIAPSSNGLIRPLIDVTRMEIEEFLRSRNIPWREDATNAELGFARNRIRHQLLPQLARDWNPRIVGAFARIADLAHEEEKWWVAEIDRMAEREFVRCHTGVELRWETLSALPRAVARRLVRRAIAEVKRNLRQIEYHHVEGVLNMRRHVRLPYVNVTRSFDWVRFEMPEFGYDGGCVPDPIPIHGPGTYPSPDRQTEICVHLAQSDGPIDPKASCATLEAEACKFRTPLELRGWRPGDHYRPQGKSRDHKVQEMFQKARVPSWRRASWPILTSGDEILWARQFGCADGFPGLEIRERSLY